MEQNLDEQLSNTPVLDEIGIVKLEILGNSFHVKDIMDPKLLQLAVIYTAYHDQQQVLSHRCAFKTK